MPTIDTKLKTALMGVATKLLVAQSTKFQSMLLKLKDDYLVKLQEDGINQINEKGPTVVCPVIIPEIERILPKLNTLRGVLSNIYKLAGTLNNISTQIEKPLPAINTATLTLEFLPAPIPPGLPVSVILGISKAIDVLKKLTDGLETGSKSLSTTSGIIIEYVRILDNLLQTVEDTLLEIVNLCASNFNDIQEAELITNIQNALLFDPENANSTLEEDIEVENELEEQLINGDLTYQGFQLTIEYDPTPTTLLPSKRIVATGLANTAVEILVEGGEANIPIEGIKLYYPTPLPLTEEEIQELQSQGNFYDSSYTYSSNNSTLITLIKNKIDNYLNGKTEEFVRYKITFNYEQPDFRSQIQSQIDWLTNWQNQYPILDLSEIIQKGQNLLEEIPDTYFTFSYNNVPITLRSVLELPLGEIILDVEEDLNFKEKYEDFLIDKKISTRNIEVISGNSTLLFPGEGNVEGAKGNFTEGVFTRTTPTRGQYRLNVINASTIDIIIETIGTTRGEDYYNFDNFPNLGAIPFEEIPENIDITKSPKPRYYDGDEYTKGWYVWDDYEKRWEFIDLQPFGYIEGVKDGDWKIKRDGNTNSYYEWIAGSYQDFITLRGKLDPENYPRWIKKNQDNWKSHVGNLWRICGDWGALYSVPKPPLGTDYTCVIYYISNENNNNNDEYNPNDTLRGVIWKWDEELVQWVPQNLGTILTYTDPSKSNIWVNNSSFDGGNISSNDIPDGGKWSTILQTDVDNSYINVCLNDSIDDNIVVSAGTAIALSLFGPTAGIIIQTTLNKIKKAVEDKYGSNSNEAKDWESKVYQTKPSNQSRSPYKKIPSLKKKYTNVFKPIRYYDNLNQNNFTDERVRLARKLFEAR